MKKSILYARNAISIIAGLIIFSIFSSFAVYAADPIIIDHNCIDIGQIPTAAIEHAKSDLHIAYGHTSHGSQLTSGMGSDSGSSFDLFMANNGSPPGLYLWNNGGTGGALDLHNYFVSGDLGNPDRYTWAQRTRDYLNNPANSDVNVVIWSWCGQAATSTANIDIYLTLMEGLITEYPDVQFVFMTGHLNGTGPAGQLHLANEHIRNHCRANNRILYDFADIESYDPDGLVNYMELAANDGCYYDSDANGSRESNWALAWQGSHVQDVDWWASGAAHSQHLNGNLKGYAAWWLWSRLAGWNINQCGPAPSGLSAVPNQEQTQILLAWSDNSQAVNETEFVIQRRENNNAWDNDYDRVGADIFQYIDTNIQVGNYSYRVLACYSGDPGEDPCYSEVSNIVSAPEQTVSIILKQDVDGYQGCTDTYLDAGNTQTNFGNMLYKTIGGDPQVSMTIKFDLPEDLVNKVIYDAKLTLFCGSVSSYVEGNYFKLYDLTEPWDENSATWYSRESDIDWSVPGGTYSTLPVSTVPIESQEFYPEFDVTGIVQQWSEQSLVNHGLILINDSVTKTVINASEYNEYGRPRLEITYSVNSVCVSDKDGDADVDGMDMALFVTEYNPNCLELFAGEFGNE
jgi:hypothetical protein